jgi:deoxyribonuclease-1
MYKFLIMICFISVSSLADDLAYTVVKDNLFWLKLYSQSYETLYCGAKKDKGDIEFVEHVYPSSWIATHLGCKDRSNCKVDLYRDASSDLHNLWPVLKRYNSSRGNVKFGEIKGEEKRFKDDDCDFERTSGKGSVVEPRDKVKGMIARSYLYMVHWYDLPANDLLPLMIAWHNKFPPSKIEKLRNISINDLQGRANPFVELLK